MCGYTAVPEVNCDFVCDLFGISEPEVAGSGNVAKVEAVADALEAKFPYNRDHCSRVVAVARAAASEMGLDGDDLDTIVEAAAVHDLGKIGVPEEILVKPAKLTEEERQIIRIHPRIAACLLSRLLYPDEFVSLVYHHHEWFDGTGYPDRRLGEDIPLGSRVIAVADAFDAMTSDRPYRKAMAVDQAKDELLKYAGSQFDPDVVIAVCRAWEKGKIAACSQ